jgi:hypothetical protein
MPLARLLVPLVALACSAAAPSVASAAIANPLLPHVQYEGMQQLRYEMGPFDIRPGQNEINNRDLDAAFKPPVPGYITRFEPNIERPDGSVPGVDVIHLHHATWAINLNPTFAAGEEKTIFQLPRGYGFRVDPSDEWLISEMIHNLLPNDDRITITWDIDFVPLDAPGAKEITEVDERWMDVAGIKFYPVFNVKKKWAEGRKTYTFPDDARGAERKKIGGNATWTAPEDMTLVGTGGHLHPGGLYTTLKQTRDGQTREIFRSDAKYWEPAGAVSWDVAMTVTDPGWRVHVRKGDVLSLHATYDVRKANWYEAMGIMPLFYAKGLQPGAVDPFAPGAALDTRGEITHGHLPENDNHGGTAAILPNPLRMLSGVRTTRMTIKDYVYGRGDLSAAGRAGRPPVIRAGQALKFKNLDAKTNTYHTITACKAPCNRETGIAYPIADATVEFDSGELGFGPDYATPTENRDTWKTPRNLRPGTYTYFCRVHPFMRGAFRVKGKKTRRS